VVKDAEAAGLQTDANLLHRMMATQFSVVVETQDPVLASLVEVSSRLCLDP
jgi:hypothetical protein